MQLGERGARVEGRVNGEMDGDGERKIGRDLFGFKIGRKIVGRLWWWVLGGSSLILKIFGLVIDIYYTWRKVSGVVSF